jgi:hypothetical protein
MPGSCRAAITHTRQLPPYNHQAYLAAVTLPSNMPVSSRATIKQTKLKVSGPQLVQTQHGSAAG